MHPEISDIRLSDFHYDLPEERIAQAPLAQRDQSKLLHYAKGEIRHHTFAELPDLLPVDSRLIFNDTRVIQARLFFRRETGALIEILLLSPVQPAEVQMAMQVRGSCVWQCMIGRKKRWKAGETLSRTFSAGEKNISLHVELIDREQNLLRFHWDGELAWVDLVAALGQLPLPPYIQRLVNEDDEARYQTVYARNEGAVAAPTAGLHFSDAVLERLNTKGIDREFVTLHVSAGTFLPVKHDAVAEHDMHAEQFLVSEALLRTLQTDERPLVVVGTTSMRVMESLYWLGHQLLEQGIPEQAQVLKLAKLYPYQWAGATLPPWQDCLDALLRYLDQNHLSQLAGETEILIMPGYPFRLCRGLITNYHMPATTLILLVAAFVGEDWRRIYETAMTNDYRFLSYGDSSLLWRA